MLATSSLPATPELGFTRSPAITSPRPSSLSSPRPTFTSPRQKAVNSPVSQTAPAPQPGRNTISVSPAQFREVAIASLRDVLSLLRIAKWKAEHKAGQDYNPDREDAFIHADLSPSNLLDALNQAINTAFADHAHSDLRIRGLNVVAHALTARGIPALVGALEEAATLGAEGLSALGAHGLQPFTPSPSLAGSPVGSPPRGSGRGVLDLQRANARLQEEKGTKRRALEEYFSFRVETRPEHLVVEWDAELGHDFLRAAMRVAQELRVQRRDPSFVDFVAFELGYQKLAQGHNPFDPLEAKMLCTPGFRTDGQTSMNIMDPGPGHVFATSRKTRWLRGTVIHVEHDQLDLAPGVHDYASPRTDSALWDFARTRLHVGMAAPVSFFAGHASSDTPAAVATAATAAFQLGAAECRVAMDGLSSGEMVDFMTKVSTSVLRHPRQQLCASFCLNYPIVDDLAPDSNGRPRFVTNQMCVAQREIGLVSEGGFDGVSFGAAADGDCAVAQLRHEKTLALVHRAHSRGLRIAMCAGQKPEDIGDAVAAGVDIIRHLNGMVSPVMQQRITKITVARDDAAASVRGRGATLLARLDSMHFEGSLTPYEVFLRTRLYTALLNGDERGVHCLLSDDAGAASALMLPPDDDKPALGRARRILRDAEPALRAAADRMGREGEAVWDGFVGRLAELTQDEDEEMCKAYEEGEVWTRLVRNYRAVLAGEEEDSS